MSPPALPVLHCFFQLVTPALYSLYFFADQGPLATTSAGSGTIGPILLSAGIHELLPMPPHCSHLYRVLRCIHIPVHMVCRVQMYLLGMDRLGSCGLNCPLLLLAGHP